MSINKPKRFLVFAICLSLSLLLSVTAKAQTGKIKWDRMQRDLDIMESILDELLSGGRGDWPGFSSGSRGIYFENYGVIFQVNLGGSMSMTFSAPVIAGEDIPDPLPPDAPPSADEYVIVDGSTGTIVKEEDMTWEKRSARLKRQALVFLSDYADAIGQLSPDDRITILIMQSGRPIFRLRSRGYTKIEQQPAGLEVSVKKRDIIDYRKGSLSEASFKTRVTFKERMDSKDENRNIDIMANILDTALSRRHRSGMSADSRNLGLYLDGLGALFLMKTEIGLTAPDVALKDYMHYLEQKEAVEAEESARGAARAKRSRITEKIDKALNDFKKELVELVGDYGHTLRTLKPAEYVVVTVDFRGSLGFFQDQPQQLIMTVRKQELDRYDRGDITLAQLQQNVTFQQY